MTDKPPRPRQPPPLPGSLRGPPFDEPFPKAKSEPPAQLDPMHDTPPPDANRMRSTPPSGSLLLSHLAERLPPDDPRDQLIQDLLAKVRLLSATNDAADRLDAASPTTPVPVSVRTRTKREIAAVAGKVMGKWSLLLFLLPLLGPVVAKRWPAYADLVNAIVRFFSP